MSKGSRIVRRVPFKKFAMVAQKRRLPNGHMMTVEYIDHPGAVLIIPFLKKDKVILMKQYRPALKDYLYEFPAGTLNKGEKPLVCASRELTEEIGYKPGKLTRLGEICPVPAYSTELITIYKGENLTPASAERDADEIITVEVRSRKEITGLFKQGKIRDAKTICALAFCGWA